MDVDRRMAADALEARYVARAQWDVRDAANARAAAELDFARREEEKRITAAKYGKRSKAATPAKAPTENRPPAGPPPLIAQAPPPTIAATACPTTPAPVAGAPSRGGGRIPWTREPPPKAEAKGKVWSRPAREPRPSIWKTPDGREALPPKCFWKCQLAKCNFLNFSERQICNKCRNPAVGHVLFDPTTQHLDNITCFYYRGPTPAAAANDTPGAASSGAAEETAPTVKRSRESSPAAVTADVRTFVAACSVFSAAAGMQPENVEWLSKAPQAMAASLLSSGAAAARARATAKAPAA